MMCKNSLNYQRIVPSSATLFIYLVNRRQYYMLKYIFDFPLSLQRILRDRKRLHGELQMMLQKWSMMELDIDTSIEPMTSDTKLLVLQKVNQRIDKILGNIPCKDWIERKRKRFQQSTVYSAFSFVFVDNFLFILLKGPTARSITYM